MNIRCGIEPGKVSGEFEKPGRKNTVFLFIAGLIFLLYIAKQHLASRKLKLVEKKSD
ncbi:MAG: hypothetical protein M1151_05220 [Candidatus Thermoplasmatota archaeon]|jgi:hypothetical protein|nr:hypothetical protein [Candidatus Thermoplasmatota archaeon]MCL5786048.1 hypothetical protein [Candidatus Thermoplasmatota archaeon]